MHSLTFQAMHQSVFTLKQGFLTMCVHAAAAAKSLQSCPTLCYPIDGSPPDSSVPGILQARTLEWVAISFSSVHAKPLQSSLTLCDPLDCSLPISSVHWIFQGRILEWVAIPSFRGPSWPRDWTRISYIGRWSLYYWVTWEARFRIFLLHKSCPLL